MNIIKDLEEIEKKMTTQQQEKAFKEYEEPILNMYPNLNKGRNLSDFREWYEIWCVENGLFFDLTTEQINENQ